MTHRNNYRIAIIGGGPGGLTLARILQTRQIKAVVFEQEHSAQARSQGGGLDLHTDTGLHALHLAGLDEEFQCIARYEDQGFRTVNQQGQLLQDRQLEGRPEVDRSALRTMLLNSLKDGTIRWGHTLCEVHQMSDGTYELIFKHGISERFDLVVGADGAWSRVRPLLSSAQPVYMGTTFIEWYMTDVDHQHPAVAELVGHGTMMAFADDDPSKDDNNKQGLIAQRNGHGQIRVYAVFNNPDLKGLDADDPSNARRWLLEQFEGWYPGLRALIEESDGTFAIRPLYRLPTDHSWDFRPGITLLGDAAHLMPPNGEGVNQAMLDAADLAQALSTSSSIEEAVQSYEQTLFARMKNVEDNVRKALEAREHREETGAV